jgi:hypothetical protein
MILGMDYCGIERRARLAKNLDPLLESAMAGLVRPIPIPLVQPREHPYLKPIRYRSELPAIILSLAGTLIARSPCAVVAARSPL